MALTIVSNANQLFTGVSTAGGFSFADLRNLGFFESTEPVSLGSCFLNYNVGVGSDPFDPVIGVSTYNVGVPSTGSISPTDLVGVVRELRLDISGSGSKVDLKNLAFGLEQANNIRKNVFISTDCVISSDDPTVAALSLTGGYNNLRLTISGQLLGAAGFGATQNTGGNGVNGGDALNIINNLGIGAKIQVTETGQLKAGGGGGGAGQNGITGSSAQYVCGSGCNGCQRSCRPGCCYDCGGGFNCCFDPCCSTYTNYCTAAGGSAGQGGAGGLGRGGNYPSGTLDGTAGTAGQPGSNGSGAGTDGGNGGSGGEYGQPGNPGSVAPQGSISDTVSYSHSTQRENDYRSGVFVNNLTSFKTMSVTVTYGWSGNLSGSLSQSLTIKDSSNNVIASGSGSGSSGSFTVFATLEPAKTYYFLSEASSSYGAFAERTAYGSISYSGAVSGGGAGPGAGGQPGYAITGAYGLAGFIVGIVTGILPEPTYGFTTSANATVGFAGTQQVWEFVSTGSTEMSIAKTQNVDLLVVGGGSNVVSGGRGGGGGAVQYRQLLTLQGGRYNISVGSAGQASSISHVDGTTFSLTANGANSSSSQGGQTIVYDGAGNEVTNTVYPSRGSGGNSIVTHGPEAYGGGGGATQNGSGGSTQSGGPCWKAYNGSGNECLGPYSANGGKGGNGLQVNVRISGTNEYFGSGGGGAAGESSNCNGPDCGVSVSQGAMGPGQYGRGRRPAGQNHGSNIPATQGILVIKYLDFVP